MATKLAKFEGELVDPHDLPVEPSSIVSTHWAIFGWSLLVVVLAGTFQLGDGPSQVMIPFLNQPLPPLCALQRFFGMSMTGVLTKVNSATVRAATAQPANAVSDWQSLGATT